MQLGDRIRIRNKRSTDRRSPLTGYLVAVEEGGRNPVVSLDAYSCARLGAQSATFTCNPKRLEVIENGS